MPTYVLQIATLLMVVASLAVAVMATVRRWHPNRVIALAVVAILVSIVLLESAGPDDRFAAMAFGLTYGTALTLACVSIGQEHRSRRDRPRTEQKEPTS